MTGSARPNGQAIFALVLLMANTVYASQIFKLGVPFSNGVEPGASFLPVLLSAVLYLAAGRILIAELRNSRSVEAPAADAKSDHVPAIGIVGPLVIAILTMGFAAGLERVGYIAAAGAYTFAVALYFNFEGGGRLMRSVIVSAMTGVLITSFGWLFFVKLFDLYLPTWSY
jgi:hypothetical protein